MDATVPILDFWAPSFIRLISNIVGTGLSGQLDEDVLLSLVSPFCDCVEAWVAKLKSIDEASAEALRGDITLRRFGPDLSTKGANDAYEECTWIRKSFVALSTICDDIF